MKCNNCSCEVEITESNFCISDFFVLITCENCFNEILEENFDYEELKEIYWEVK